MATVKLLVGLGNPGAEYERTRHNAGFWWIDRLCEREHLQLRAERKFHGLVARYDGSDADLWLLEPQTFMNASGRAVAALAQFYKVAVEEILVVHDELDLPPGAIRFKQGGGHAGHNGLRDMLAQLGSGDFWRLRVGIGHPGDKAEVINYVLNAPRSEERTAIDEAIARSLEVFPLIAKGELTAATMKLHTKPKPAAQAKPPASQEPSQ